MYWKKNMRLISTASDQAWRTVNTEKLMRQHTLSKPNKELAQRPITVRTTLLGPWLKCCVSLLDDLLELGVRRRRSLAGVELDRPKSDCRSFLLPGFAAAWQLAELLLFFSVRRLSPLSDELVSLRTEKENRKRQRGRGVVTREKRNESEKLEWCLR